MTITKWLGILGAVAVLLACGAFLPSLRWGIGLGASVAILLGFAKGLLAACQYLDQRRREIANRRFQIYHNLIEQLVKPDKDVGHTFLHRQVAIVFELRNFSEYREVTIRILEDLKAKWSQKVRRHDLLLSEIDLTIGQLRQ